jgi:hypothetical protein
VEKVSTLYLTGIGLRDKAGDGQAPHIEVKPKPGSPALSKKLVPPASKQAAFSRPVQPDLAMLAFSAILPVFLFGIWNSQRTLLLPVLGILVIFYGLFFWQRKKLLVRYQQNVAARLASEERIKKGIGLWMKMYYCAEDEVVFEPGKGEPVSIDLLPGFLMQQ